MRIAIIGCGPAGLSAAIALHSRDFEVTLFERFEQPAPVGSGLVLQPTGLTVLDTLQLREETEALGQRINRMLGKLSTSGRTVLDISYGVVDQALYGVAIHRASLFHVLFTAVQQRDIPIETNCTITSVTTKGNHCQLIAAQRSVNTTFDLVVDASGVNSNIVATTHQAIKRKDLSFGALWATVALREFAPDILEQRYVRANKMIGILPCGTLPGQNEPLATLFYSLEKEQFNAWNSSRLLRWKQEVQSLWPETKSLLEQLQSPQQLTFASYSHFTLRPPHKDAIFFIGDSAHATSPQLGQGANMALLDALALTIALSENRGSIANAQARYTSLRRTHTYLYQWASYLLTPFYQSNSRILPLMRDALFNVTTSVGAIDRLVTRLGSGILTRPETSLAALYKKCAGTSGPF